MDADIEWITKRLLGPYRLTGSLHPPTPTEESIFLFFLLNTKYELIGDLTLLSSLPTHFLFFN